MGEGLRDMRDQLAPGYFQSFILAQRDDDMLLCTEATPTLCLQNVSHQM